MPTPYVTPAMLLSAPTGISWSTIPSNQATAQEKLAEQTNICWRATYEADRICGQVLRATADVEQQQAPSFRVTLKPNGTTSMILSRWPVIEVIGAQVAATIPPQWTTIPADKLMLDHITPGAFGTSSPDATPTGPAGILIAPGYVDWSMGREAYTVQATYINGWPHTSLTADCIVGATTLHVDDVTGWLGGVGTIYDGADTEQVTVTAVTPDVVATIPSGPGTVTLAGATLYAHVAGVLLTTMPANLQWAVIQLCCAQALTRGSTATTVGQLPGAASNAGGGSAATLHTAAEKMLAAYARVW